MHLEEIEDLALEQTQQQILVEEAAALLTHLEIFEGIPVFAAVTGALLNLQVAHKTEVTARRLFQDAGCADNGKVDAIAAALDGGKLPRSAGGRAPCRAGYTTVYSVSFRHRPSGLPDGRDAHPRPLDRSRCEARRRQAPTARSKPSASRPSQPAARRVSDGVTGQDRG